MPLELDFRALLDSMSSIVGVYFLILLQLSRVLEMNRTKIEG